MDVANDVDLAVEELPHQLIGDTEEVFAHRQPLWIGAPEIG